MSSPLTPAEYSKHATCFSTYDVGSGSTPNCYGLEYVNDTEASVVDFVESLVQAQIQYPTYLWLAAAGIVPSNTTTYSLASVSAVLTKASGAEPYVRLMSRLRGGHGSQNES